MINVAILTPCLLERDAVGHDAIGMCDALTKQGYNAQLFAETWSVSTVDVKHASEIQNFLTNPSSILIYHFSVGWDSGLQLLQTLECQKIVKYHNVTPAKYFESISVDYVNACQAGREQLKLVASQSDVLYLSDSEYNARELEALGVPKAKSFVLPPFHRIEQSHYGNADLTVLDQFLDGMFNILMVGRLVPNKGHLALLDAFNVYYKIYNRNSRLLIVGKEDERLETYNRFLHRRVEDLGLEKAVIFTGGVSAEALKAYYLIANVFMITSDHEGFCVPLVEAMSLKLPIVAYGSTAIPSTVGKAGLVWDQPDSYLLAGSLDHIANDETVRIGLGELGWRRYQEMFSYQKLEARFLAFIQHLA
ncbi:MAG: glycosyltransferase family 4 protein [Myxacorys californica WJT36-NPBG1]|jgi:glycosyltransferase involved in cell wall biosynthesis|nr:glycosyltransferase family 4 protein [Myxacorys californica WJT36-NPBG1]